MFSKVLISVTRMLGGDKILPDQIRKEISRTHTAILTRTRTHRRESVGKKHIRNMTTVRAAKSGLSRETQQKINAKFDPDLAHKCLEWIRDMINANLDPGEEPVDFNTSGDAKNFSAVLHNGVLLARLANVLVPGSVPRSKYAREPKLAFKQMELIEIFINKSREFGVPDHESFQTVDLFEEQNLYQVLVSLQSLGRKTKARGMLGFGPKEAEANPRNFTEEQLKAGVNIISLQMGTNKGATQSGMTFGKQRMIID